MLSFYLSASVHNQLHNSSCVKCVKSPRVLLQHYQTLHWSVFIDRKHAASKQVWNTLNLNVSALKLCQKIHKPEVSALSDIIAANIKTLDSSESSTINISRHTNFQNRFIIGRRKIGGWDVGRGRGEGITIGEKITVWSNYINLKQ